MIGVLPLLAGAALVGAIHMSAPDHWLTLCVLGQAQHWTRGRLVGLALVAAAGHVVLSVALGFLILAAGLIFSASAVTDLAVLTGGVMVVGGLSYAVKSLRQRSGGPSAVRAAGGQNKGPTYVAVLGAALSPDLSILPTFILAIPLGASLAVDAAAVFAVASIATLAVFVLVGSMGLAEVLAKVPEKYNDALVGSVVAAVGLYVIAYG